MSDSAANRVAMNEGPLSAIRTSTSRLLRWKPIGPTLTF